MPGLAVFTPIRLGGAGGGGVYSSTKRGPVNAGLAHVMRALQIKSPFEEYLQDHDTS